jgi:hypothetical protein
LDKEVWSISDYEYRSFLETHWRKIRDLHFRETPYWISRVKKYGIESDGLKLDDFLRHPASLCDENDLIERPFEYFIPKSLLGAQSKDIGIYTSSGSTGKKKNAPWDNEALDYDSRFLSYILDMYEIPKGLNFLVAGPSFPAPFQPIMEKLAKERNGLFYFAPLETRGLKKHLDSVDTSKLDITSDSFLNARLSPSVEYQLEILGKEKIGVLGIALFSLPLFVRAAGFENVLLVYCGGMEIPPEQYKYWKKELEAKGKKLVTSYGHYIFGLIFDAPGEGLTYYPPLPQSLLHVVKRDDPYELVDYSQRGRVRFLRMSKALLWSQVERDYADRAAPVKEFNWDGVRNITSSF